MVDAIYAELFDLKKTCRGCMALVGEYEYISLHEESSLHKEQFTIVEKFECCTSLHIEKEDHLPQILCKNCVKRIDEAFALRLQCRNSDAVLRNYLEMKDESDTLKQNNKCNPIEEIKSRNFVGSISSSLNKAGNDVEEEYLNILSQNTLNENTAIFFTQPKKTSKKDGKSLYTCAECNKSFKALSALNLHKKLHNKEDKQCISLDTKNEEVKIKNKDVSFESAVSLTADSNNISIPKLTCDVCNKTYLKPSNLAAHMGLHTGIKPYNCKICGQKFTQGRAMATHMRTHKIPKPHCSKCDHQFENDNELKTHEENTACNSETPNIKKGIKHKKKKKRPQPHTCSICQHHYSNLGNLRAHMILHLGDKPYSCNICDRTFAQSNAHSYHMTTHLKKTFCCDLCPKSFTTNAQLINHQRLHTGEKPFACTICPKRFTQKITYAIHMMTHTGDKPFLCSVCGKKYAQNSQLVEHMRTHTGEKYVCDQCNKSYSTAGNLAAHIRTHSGIKPFICVVCSKSFYVASKLAKHMRSHTEETPFPCPVCPKRFTCSEALTAHLGTHTEESPFMCTICDKRFINNSQLTLHFKTHMNESMTSTTVNLISHTPTCVDSISSAVYNTPCENYNINSNTLYTL